MDRWWSHFVKCTVNPVTDFKIFLKRLEVDVRSFFFNGLIEHQVDIANDRRRVCLRLEIRFAYPVATDLKLAQNILHCLSLAAIALVDFCLYEIVRRDDHIDLTT